MNNKNDFLTLFSDKVLYFRKQINLIHFLKLASSCDIKWRHDVNALNFNPWMHFGGMCAIRVYNDYLDAGRVSTYKEADFEIYLFERFENE